MSKNSKEEGDSISASLMPRRSFGNKRKRTPRNSISSLEVSILDDENSKMISQSISVGLKRQRIDEDAEII
jgi:hypothetical protein